MYSPRARAADAPPSPTTISPSSPPRASALAPKAGAALQRVEAQSSVDLESYVRALGDKRYAAVKGMRRAALLSRARAELGTDQLDDVTVRRHTNLASAEASRAKKEFIMDELHSQLRIKSDDAVLLAGEVRRLAAVVDDFVASNGALEAQVRVLAQQQQQQQQQQLQQHQHQHQAHHRLPVDQFLPAPQLQQQQQAYGGAGVPAQTGMSAVGERWFALPEQQYYSAVAAMEEIADRSSLSCVAEQERGVGAAATRGVGDATSGVAVSSVMTNVSTGSQQAFFGQQQQKQQQQQQQQQLGQARRAAGLQQQFEGMEDADDAMGCQQADGEAGGAESTVGAYEAEAVEDAKMGGVGAGFSALQQDLSESLHFSTAS